MYKFYRAERIKNSYLVAEQNPCIVISVWDIEKLTGENVQSLVLEVNNDLEFITNIAKFISVTGLRNPVRVPCL
jgi:hypothetical protein